MLKALSKQEDVPPSCVFQDINNDRLSDTALNFLDVAEPSAASSKPQKAKAYVAMRDWLAHNRAWDFRGRSRCVVHDDDCPTHPQPAAKRRLGEDETSTKRPLVLNTSGMTCKGWSTTGARLQFADKSERPNSIWLVERMWWAEQGREDIFRRMHSVLPNTGKKCRDLGAHAHCDVDLDRARSRGVAPPVPQHVLCGLEQANHRMDRPPGLG